ncbi:unnamed protein product [Urochloa humidicola]
MASPGGSKDAVPFPQARYDPDAEKRQKRQRLSDEGLKYDPKHGGSQHASMLSVGGSRGVGSSSQQVVVTLTVAIEDYDDPIEEAIERARDAAMRNEHIDDILIEECKEEALDKLYSTNENLSSRVYKRFYRCPFCPARMCRRWTLPVLLEHARAYGVPGRRDVKPTGEHQALEEYILYA